MEQYDVIDHDGESVNEGDSIFSFRGEEATFLAVTRWSRSGNTPKIQVKWLKDGFEGEYYATVFNLNVKAR